MFCLKMSGIFAFALSSTNPNTQAPYNSTYNIPLFDNICLTLSEKSKILSKNDLNNYLCFCMEKKTGKKFFIEDRENVIKWLKRVKSPLMKTLSRTFVDISKYLKDEFKKQEQAIKFLMGETDLNLRVDDCPIANYII